MIALYLFSGGVMIVNKYLDARPTDADVRAVMRMRGADSAKLVQFPGNVTLATF